MSQAFPEKIPTSTVPMLPPRMRVLFITNDQHLGCNLAESLAADRTTQMILERSVGASAGLARLRDDVFDAVLVAHDESLDAFEVLDALRAGTSPRQAVIVIGGPTAEQLGPYCFEAGADSYLCLGSATTRSLLWHLAKAIERHRLLADNDRLEQLRRQQTTAETVEAERLLSQQRRMLELVQQRSGQLADWQPPQPLVDHYRELLQTSVVMGWGNMEEEVTRFNGVLTSAGISADQFMAFHIVAVESLVGELGSRGAKHVMNRADLLALEILLRLCQNYRQGILDSLGSVGSAAA
jgi:DNA-binding response OmpR family regulator